MEGVPNEIIIINTDKKLSFPSDIELFIEQQILIFVFSKKNSILGMHVILESVMRLIHY